VISIPDPLVDGSPIPMIEDDGDANPYGDPAGTELKDLAFGLQKDHADTKPPVLHLPDHVNAKTKGTSSVTVDFTPSATDAVDGSVTVTCTPPSGSSFPIGETIVHCSATDAHGNTASGSFPIDVSSR
jgi:hypothetical protein